jgi:hypothetical protein
MSDEHRNHHFKSTRSWRCRRALIDPPEEIGGHELPA